MILGEMGLLADDGEKVQCHICGKRFLALGHHIQIKHGVDCDEYRKIYGFNRTQALVSSRYTQIQRAATLEHLSKTWHVKGEPRLPWPSTKGQKMRLQGVNAVSDVNKRPERRLKQSERFRLGLHPFTTDDVKKKRLLTQRLPEFREKMRKNAWILFRPDIRKKTLEAARAAKKKQKADRDRFRMEETP